MFGLRGMGGVGKTTTAIAVAHSDEVLEEFGADNIWWITVGQTTTGADVLKEFARKVCRCQYLECVYARARVCLCPYW